MYGGETVRGTCVADSRCILTAGYYIGGGQWICWLHALLSPAVDKAIQQTGQPLQALPKEKTVKEKLTDYRIQVTATRGEQLIVERQYQSSPDHWVTTGKYMTAEISRIPKNREHWMEEVPSLFENSVVPRCPVCLFPLADKLEDGCVPGNCSYRPPEGSPEYYRIQARRRELEEMRFAAEHADVVQANVTEAAPAELDPEQVLPSIY